MKKSLLAIVLAVVSIGAYAQNVTENTDKYKVETNRFWNNWFISVGGGAQVYFGDDSGKAGFGDRLAPALDIAVGKWFTPGLGLRLGYNGLQAKNATLNAGAPYIDGRESGYYTQKWDLANVHADVLINLSNMLCGYSESRFYSFIPYAGLGWLHSYDAPKNDEFGFNAGLINRFRLSPAFDLNLEIRGILFKDQLAGGLNKAGIGGATLGFTYKFKQRDFKRGTIVNTGISEDELRRIQNQLRESQAYNDQLKAELEAARNKKPTVVLPEKVYADNAPRVIFFPIGSSKLTPQDLVHVQNIAKAIKNGDPNKTYNVYGYADKQTGSASWNEKLSKARAQAVADALVKEGVSKDRIKVDGKGGVGVMYLNNSKLSRVVITE